MKKIYFFLISFLVLNVSISYGQASYAEFFVSPTEVCGPELIHFSNTSYIDAVDTVGPVEYKWYINGNMVFNGFNIPDTILGPGYYTTRFEIIDNGSLFRDAVQDFTLLGFSGTFHTELLP